MRANAVTEHEALDLYPFWPQGAYMHLHVASQRRPTASTLSFLALPIHTSCPGPSFRSQAPRHTAMVSEGHHRAKSRVIRRQLWTTEWAARDLGLIAPTADQSDGKQIECGSVEETKAEILVTRTGPCPCVHAACTGANVTVGTAAAKVHEPSVVGIDVNGSRTEERDEL